MLQTLIPYEGALKKLQMHELIFVNYLKIYHSMARPQVAYAGGSIWVWWTDANMLNKQLLIARKG
jgi:hypothetical protein